MFQMLFDLDELPGLATRLKLFSHNRFNIFSFHDADHGLGGAGSLRSYVEGVLATAQLSLAGGRIALLCMPRIFGHVFNPLSVYYCHHANGALTAMIYEVNNTFGQRHTYLIPAAEQASGLIEQSCEKLFYVSPFMDMEMIYDFKLTPPGETIVTVVNGKDSEGTPLLYAAFNGKRRGLSDRTLTGALLAYPFQTLGVVAAIHWEALKLAVKGMRLRARPSAPAAGLTVVGAPTPSRGEAV